MGRIPGWSPVCSACEPKGVELKTIGLVNQECAGCGEKATCCLAPEDSIDCTKAVEKWANELSAVLERCPALVTPQMILPVFNARIGAFMAARFPGVEISAEDQLHAGVAASGVAVPEHAMEAAMFGINRFKALLELFMEACQSAAIPDDPAEREQALERMMYESLDEVFPQRPSGEPKLTLVQ